MAKERGQADAQRLDGRGLGIVVAVSRFNWSVTKLMRDRCVNRLIELGVSEQHVHVVEVPGALELPIALQQELRRHRAQAAIALGAVVRGETDHYEFVARTAIEGIQRVALDENVPIIMGVLTTGSLEQATDRVKQATHYADNAVEMARVVEKPGTRLPVNSFLR